MSAWNVIAGVLYHGLQGRWRLGGLEPAQNFDEAVTKAQLDAIAPFPFTGDATIDGTLNIDFTDTLDFKTGEVEFPMALPQSSILSFGLGLPDFEGHFVGSVSEDDDEIFYAGLADGKLVIDDGRGGTLEAPTQVLISQFYNETELIASSVSKSEPPTGIFLTAEQRGLFDMGDEEFIEFVSAIAKYPDNADMFLKRVESNNDSLEFGTYSDSKGFEIRSSTSDPDANIFSVKNENDTEPKFQIKANGIFVGGNIPTTDPGELGQIWLDGDTLKVSAGAP